MFLNAILNYVLTSVMEIPPLPLPPSLRDIRTHMGPTQFSMIYFRETYNNAPKERHFFIYIYKRIYIYIYMYT